MTQAHFDFFDHSGHLLDRVDVEILDTAGARAWTYAVLLNSPDRQPVRIKRQNRNLTQDTKWLAEIHQTLAQLDDLGYTYPREFPNELDALSFDHFNQLHRYFTESAVNLWAEKTKPYHEISKVDAPFQKLNNLIHNLESVNPTARRINYIDNSKEILVTPIGSEIGYDIKPFRECHSFSHSDVIIDGYILGKTLLEAYLCNDRPDAWDTSGNIRTNGGCVFLLTEYRAQLYQTPEFNNWLSEYNCNQQNTYADFPIGNFTPSSKVKAEQLLTLPLWQTTCQVSVTI